MLQSAGAWYRPNRPPDLSRAAAGVAAARATANQAATTATIPSPFTVKWPANSDYAAGNYGAYASSALTNPSIAAVVCNVNWSAVEATQGSRDWGPLDNVLASWKAAGKHVGICARYASQKNGPGHANGILPSWEVARIETIDDVDTGFLVPNHFNTTFQADWKAFVSALGAHLTGHANLDALAYVRIGCGLGGEGFYLMKPSGPNWATYRSQMATWAGSTSAAFPNAWRAYQEMLLAYYRSVIPATVPVLYPIVSAVASDITDTGNQMAVDVGKWALAAGNYGLAQDGLPYTSGSTGGYGTYAGMNVLMPWVAANYPSAYIQFQAEQGLTSAQVAQSITNAESLGGRTIEWYEAADATNLANQAAFNGYQSWVSSRFA